MQFLLTFIVLSAAVIYIIWRLFGLVSGKDDPCKGCELKKNCRKFGQYKEK